MNATTIDEQRARYFLRGWYEDGVTVAQIGHFYCELASAKCDAARFSEQYRRVAVIDAITQQTLYEVAHTEIRS